MNTTAVPGKKMFILLFGIFAKAEIMGDTAEKSSYPEDDYLVDKKSNIWYDYSV